MIWMLIIGFALMLFSLSNYIVIKEETNNDNIK